MALKHLKCKIFIPHGDWCHAHRRRIENEAAGFKICILSSPGQSWIRWFLLRNFKMNWLKLLFLFFANHPHNLYLFIFFFLVVSFCQFFFSQLISLAFWNDHLSFCDEIYEWIPASIFFIALVPKAKFSVLIFCLNKGLWVP